jgi:branched-chain amino acid transport system ATP-binding protein
MNMSFLELKNVDVYYEDVPAIRGVSLKIEKGELVSIIGANGAGKTTTLNTISGLLQPRPGEIWFEDKRIDTLPAHRVAGRGIVQIPEGRRLFPLMTVLENLKIGAYSPCAKGDYRRTLQDVFNLLPLLKERRNQIAHTLSGGEQQMLAIGRGLMGKPRLLMLDEPSLGLAPILVRAVFETVKKIKSQGTTVLLVEQNVRHSLELAHRGYVMENGRITLEGTGLEVLNNSHVKSAYLGI